MMEKLVRQLGANEGLEDQWLRRWKDGRNILDAHWLFE